MAKIRVSKPIGGGDPDKIPTPPGGTQRSAQGNELKNQPKLADDYATRDTIHSFIARGDTDLKSEEAKASYRDLVNKLGAPMAGKVLAHTFDFNSRPDVQRLPFNQKISSYYSIGSNDPELGKLIDMNGRLGQGPVAATYEDPNISVMAATGRK